MLVYAIVLIVVMLATNNPTIKGFLENLKSKITQAKIRKKRRAFEMTTAEKWFPCPFQEHRSGT